MGMFDQLKNSALGALGGSGGNAQLTSLIGPLMEHLGGGGLQGLLAQLNQAGLGNVVQSWVGTGNNQPVSAQQLQGALSPDLVNSLAQKAGISPDQIHAALAAVLPHVVDHLTPGGQLPAAGAPVPDASSLLSKLFG